MGKITFKGLVPKDDPMFSTGPQLFSRPGSSESSTTSASATAGTMPAASTSAKKDETTPDEKADGALRLAKFRHQNEQLKKR